MLKITHPRHDPHQLHPKNPPVPARAPRLPHRGVPERPARRGGGPAVWRAQWTPPERECRRRAPPGPQLRPSAKTAPIGAPRSRPLRPCGTPALSCPLLSWRKAQGAAPTQ